jgi:23S rRNA (cytosine1962-C5)-methyltransferase
MDKLTSHIKSYTKSHPGAGRLFHGRGKSISGLEYLNIDFYHPYIMLIFYKEPSFELVDNLVRILVSELSNECLGIFIQKRFLSHSPIEIVWGEVPNEYVATIEDHKYALKFGQSQNIGFFPDMKLGRQFLMKYSEGKTILNLFSYTCALSVVALKNNAKKVINFDMSKGAIKRGEENHRLNGIDFRRVKFFSHDIFKSFARIKKEGPYDIIIIDPPSDHGDNFKLERDYPKLIQKLSDQIIEGGLLMTCLNSPHHTFKFLEELVTKNSDQFTLIDKFGLPVEYLETDIESGLKILIWKKK